MLEDLEFLKAAEVEVEEVKEACLTRSWSPGLGSPPLVAPDFSMAACLETERLYLAFLYFIFTSVLSNFCPN